MPCEISSMSCSLCPYCATKGCPHLHDKPKRLKIKVTLTPLNKAIKGLFSLYHFHQVKYQFNKTYKTRKQWFDECKKGETISYLKKELKFFYFLNPTEKEILQELENINFKDLRKEMSNWSNPHICYLHQIKLSYLQN